MTARKITLVAGVTLEAEAEESAIDEVYAEMRDGYKELLENHVREPGWDTPLLWLAYSALAEGSPKSLRALGAYVEAIAQEIERD